MQTKNAKKLFEVAQKIANETPEFFDKKGPGLGNTATNEFMRKLRDQMIKELGDDFSEKKICGNNAFAVDFYFPSESTIVEMAFSLSSPMSEYERDILKSVMFQDQGNSIRGLVLISKPGAIKKCLQPGRVAMKNWLKNRFNIELDIYELCKPK